MPLNCNDVVLEEKGKIVSTERHYISSMKMNETRKKRRIASFLSYLSSVVPTLLEFDSSHVPNENSDHNTQNIMILSGEYDSLFDILQRIILIPETFFFIEKFVDEKKCRAIYIHLLECMEENSKGKSEREGQAYEKKKSLSVSTKSVRERERERRIERN